MFPDPLSLLLLALPPALQQSLGGAAPDAPPRSFRPKLELRDEFTQPTWFPVEPTIIGPRGLVFSNENDLDTDLNGDTDQTDDVLQSVDLRTGVVTNLGLACSNRFVFDPAQPDHVLVPVSEASQGNQDQNGDGDHGDTVLFDVNLAAGSSRSSGLATASWDQALVSGRWAAIKVSEADEGAGDLDGDGVIGLVLFRWDLSGAGSPMNAGTSVNLFQAAHESYFLFTVAESVGGADLNGDGDASDHVLHALHGPTGNVISTGLAGDAYAQGPYSVMTVSEMAQGQDLNGDGDIVDSVPHAFSLLTGQLLNLGVNLSTPSVLAGGHGASRAARSYAISDEGFAFHVSEPNEGGVDLNGDGDVTDPDILFVHVFATGETRNLGLSVWDYELEDGLLAMQVGKFGMGMGFRTDVHDLAQNTTWNSGVRTVHSTSRTSFRIQGDWIAVVAYEAGVDHTGDGTVTDSYLVLANERDHRIIDTGMAISRSGALEYRLVFHDGGMLAALAYEPDMATDLNGDGDLLDHVVRLFQPDHGVELDTGQGASLLLPGYRQNYPFVARESEDATDHNGDGDAQDTVLRQVRLKLR